MCKLTLIVLFFTIVAFVMAAPTLLSDQEEWSKFKAGFNRTYETDEEEAKRFDIFQTNLKNVREHNEKFSKGEVSYTQGVNQFADLTPEEFKSQFLRGYRGKATPQ